MNAILVLLGGALVKLVLTGTYLRYVRPGLAPWLLAAGATLLVLAGTALVRDLRGHHHDDGHHHGRWSRWLLIVPVLVVFLAAPPALGADSVVRSSGRSAPAPQHFAPLPAHGVVTLGLSEFVARSVWDSSGSLNGRTVRLTGFVVHEHGTTYLARLVITCCAADATPMTVRLDGAPAATLPDNQWVTAEGVLEPGSASQSDGYTPALRASTLVTTTAPANPYEY